MYPDGISQATIHPRGFHEEPVHESVALTVSGGATPNDTSDEVLVKGCATLGLWAKNEGSSTQVDVELYVCHRKGGEYSNVPYATLTLGAGESDSIPISPGGVYGTKVKIVNQDASNATTVSTVLSASWR